MPNAPIGAPANDRVREIEMRLFEEVGTQLKAVTGALKDMTLEMRDVRERLIRIEAQDQPKKIAALEHDLREAQVEIVRIEKEATDALAALAAHSQAERARIEQAAAMNLATEIAKIATTTAADKLALEKRLTRMEVIIAPLTVGGSAILAAIIGAIVTLVSGHLHL